MNRKRLAAAMFVPAALAVTPALGSTSSTPRCSTADLRLELVRTLGAAGSRDADFALRDVAPGTCQLQGYPGVKFLNRHASPMNVTVDRAPGTPMPVVLHAWQRAFFTLHYASNLPCSAGVFPAGEQVTPPGSTRSLRIYHPIGVCAGTRPDVTPMRARLGNL